MKVAIIGGGASGLMCASFLKRNNSKLDITIYEKNKGLGRKILASGNGKCNFMNYKATILIIIILILLKIFLIIQIKRM